MSSRSRSVKTLLAVFAGQALVGDHGGARSGPVGRLAGYDLAGLLAFAEQLGVG
jgi:hypothetical protein